MQVRNWTQNITFKAIGVGLLALVMLIPLAQVQSLVGERRGLEGEARERIAERWGRQQIIGGPVLVVPVRRQVQGEKGWILADEERYLLPEQLLIEGGLATEVRQYGIYATPIYTAALSVSGSFSSDSLRVLGANGGEPQWAQAVLRVPVADVRGIRSLSALTLDGVERPFGPGSGGFGGVSATEVPWSIDLDAARSAHDFSFNLRLAGTASLSVLPLARRTDVRLTGAWPDPSFSGAFLPESHTDFIIAVLSEEFGLRGVLVLMTIYLLILLRGFWIGIRARSSFGRMAAGSLTLTFFVYVFVNMGMVAGLLPVVGVPLPLVSAGGTSVVTLMAGFGILMAISTEKSAVPR